MRVLHLASFNRWTGATAPALAEAEALQEAGVEALFGFVGNHKLEERLRDTAFAHPIIEQSQNPASMFRSMQAITRFAQERGVEILHAHLTYDHVLATMVAQRLGLRVVRTFHSRRTLRRDPFTRSLMRRTHGVAVVNDTFLQRVESDNAVFTPPPVNQRIFRPDGPNARQTLGLAADHPVVGLIGKVSPHRGFEDAFETFALVRQSMPRARMVVVGHGPHRDSLEALARKLSIAGQTIWVGYHEEDLPEYFRVMNTMMFTRTGSDEGHRAVIEALACGVPVGCFPLPGVSTLLGKLSSRLLAREEKPEALAPVIVGQLQRPIEAPECVAATELNSYANTAQRLIDLYRRLPSG